VGDGEGGPRIKGTEEVAPPGLGVQAGGTCDCRPTKQVPSNEAEPSNTGGMRPLSPITLFRRPGLRKGLAAGLPPPKPPALKKPKVSEAPPLVPVLAPPLPGVGVLLASAAPEIPPPLHMKPTGASECSDAGVALSDGVANLRLSSRAGIGPNMGCCLDEAARLSNISFNERFRPAEAGSTMMLAWADCCCCCC